MTNNVCYNRMSVIKIFCEIFCQILESLFLNMLRFVLPCVTLLLMNVFHQSVFRIQSKLLFLMDDMVRQIGIICFVYNSFSH